MASLFRRNARKPIERLLARQKRKHPREVNAILADKKKFAALEARIEEYANKRGVQKLFGASDPDNPRQFGGMLTWLVTNWADIFKMIKDIISLFNSLNAV